MTTERKFSHRITPLRLVPAKSEAQKRAEEAARRLLPEYRQAVADGLPRAPLAPTPLQATAQANVRAANAPPSFQAQLPPGAAPLNPSRPVATSGDALLRMLSSLAVPSQAAAAGLFLGGEALIPGEQSQEREFKRNLAAGQGPIRANLAAYRATDRPTVRVPVSPVPIPLPFGKTLQKVDIGAKGAAELLFDPLNLVGGSAPKVLGKIARITAEQAAGTGRLAKSAVMGAARNIAEAPKANPQAGFIKLPGDTAAAHPDVKAIFEDRDKALKELVSAKRALNAKSPLGKQRIFAAEGEIRTLDTLLSNTLESRLSPDEWQRYQKLREEAGVQAGMLGVPDKAFTPQGKGVVTQIGMDDQLKLQQAKIAAAEQAAKSATPSVAPTAAALPKPAVARRRTVEELLKLGGYDEADWSISNNPFGKAALQESGLANARTFKRMAENLETNIDTHGWEAIENHLDMELPRDVAKAKQLIESEGERRIRMYQKALNDAAEEKSLAKEEAIKKALAEHGATKAVTPKVSENLVTPKKPTPAQVAKQAREAAVYKANQTAFTKAAGPQPSPSAPPTAVQPPAAVRPVVSADPGLRQAPVTLLPAPKEPIGLLTAGGTRVKPPTWRGPERGPRIFYAPNASLQAQMEAEIIEITRGAQSLADAEAARGPIIAGPGSNRAQAVARQAQGGNIPPSGNVIVTPQPEAPIPGVRTGRGLLGDIPGFGPGTGAAPETANVVTTDSKVKRFLVGRLGINPSILENSPVGKAVTAYYRNIIASENLRTVAMSSLDAFAQRFTGRMGAVIPIKKGGFYGNTGKLWQDVFSDPTAYNLTQKQLAYIDTYHELVNEAEAFRLLHGLPDVPKTKDGWYYTPRQVDDIRGVDPGRASNSHLQRVHEFATDGHAAGVDYSLDPRATLELHIKAAQREVINKELAAAVADHAVSPSKLIDPALAQARLAAIKAQALAEKNARARIQAAAKKSGKTPMPSTFALGVSRDPAVIAARQANDLARIRYKRALETARRTTVAEGSIFNDPKQDISIGMWRNNFYKKEWADKLRKAAGDIGVGPQQANPFLGNVEKVVNVGRYLKANMDFAAPFNQGLSLMGHPVTWARATVFHYRAFFDPRAVSDLMLNDMATFQKMAQNSIPLGDTEFFRALQEGGGFQPGKVLEYFGEGGKVARRNIQIANKQTSGRFATSYGAFLLRSRYELWKTLEPGWKGTEAELASHIRNMTGGLDARALGAGPNHRAVESVFLAFSPKLLRSTLALSAEFIANPLSPKGRDAGRSLAALAAVAVSTYYLTGKALGKSEEEIADGLNPLNGKKFLGHELPDGNWVGVGGQVRAITQLLVRGAAEPESLLSPDPYDNPLIAFYNSRGAMGTTQLAGVAEFASGGQWNTAPYAYLNDWSDFLAHEGSSFTPMLVQNMVEGQSAIANAFSEMGARTSPPSSVWTETNEAFDALPGIKELNAAIEKMPAPLDSNGQQMKRFGPIQLGQVGSSFDMTTGVTGDSITLTPQQRAEYQKLMGRVVIEGVVQFEKDWNNPYFTDVKKRKELERTMGNMRALAQRRYRVLLNYQKQPVGATP